MTEHVFDIQKNVNPHFKKVWTTDCDYIILKGGRSSFKSSVVALKLAYTMLKQMQHGRRGNIVVLRKTANTLRDSVLPKMQWAFTKLGIISRFKTTVSPIEMKDVLTGSCVKFYGQDDFQKLKSNDINDILAVWYEEAAEFKNREEFDQTNSTFMRQKSPYVDAVKFYWSYNPPRNPYNWVNEWADEVRDAPNYLVDSSSYLDDKLGFITKQARAEIERIKANDLDYYKYLYLGEPVGLGTNVYNMANFHPMAELPDDDDLVAWYCSIDAGHEVSATTFGAYALTKKQRVILLDTFYYSPQGKTHKRPPSELAKNLKDFVDKITDTYHMQPRKLIIDSAEGALDNQFYTDYGVKLTKVHKLKKVDMVDRVHSILAQGRFYYLDIPDNEIFITEHKMYRWDERTLESDDPKVIKENDHTCDQLQYFARSCERELGLKY